MLIVQIGFNECGATALSKLVRHTGLRTLHGDGAYWREKGHPAVAGRNAQLIIQANLRAGRPALVGLEDFEAFFGLEYVQDAWNIENFRHFDRIAEDYPQARFLLNTCDSDDWLQARMLRAGGQYLDRAMKRTGMSRRGILNLWADDFHRHHDMVRNYFRDTPDRLFEVEINHTQARDLVRYVRPGMRMWPRPWRRSNLDSAIRAA